MFRKVLCPQREGQACSNPPKMVTMERTIQKRTQKGEEGSRCSCDGQSRVGGCEMRLRILKLFGNWLEKQVHVGLTFLEAPDHLTLSCQPHRPGARLVSSKGREPAAWEGPAAELLFPRWEEVGSCLTINSIPTGWALSTSSPAAVSLAEFLTELLPASVTEQETTFGWGQITCSASKFIHPGRGLNWRSACDSQWTDCFHPPPICKVRKT